ncbi:LOW QUALITY PROTEIN: perforin-1-like [Zonotrichia albicollis]|uniref:LOW QUALITY PROTEIN: perforin-1-like n=1 Tax=Zonotrichia albicollis TaxID=44394 RepID=UPI003D811D6F
MAPAVTMAMSPGVAAGVCCVPTPCTRCPPRRVPSAIGGWRSGRRCRRQSRVAAGASAVGTAVTSSVTKGWSFGVSWGRGRGLGVLGEGSQSRVAQEGLRWQRQDRSALSWQELVCTFYWTWLEPSAARPSPSFLRAVRSLPPHFTPATAGLYAELVSGWGTHAVVAARLGGRLRTLTAVRLCRAAMAGVGAQEASLPADGADLRPGRRGPSGPRAGRPARPPRATSASASSSASGCSRWTAALTATATWPSGGPQDFGRWLKGVPAAPAVVEADLWPLDALVPRSDPRRRSLRAAIRSYVAAKALRVNCSCGRSGQQGDRLSDHLSDHPCHCPCSATPLPVGRVPVLPRPTRAWRTCP